jgi:hypothetical protein
LKNHKSFHEELIELNICDHPMKPTNTILKDENIISYGISNSHDCSTKNNVTTCVVVSKYEHDNIKNVTLSSISTRPENTLKVTISYNENENSNSEDAIGYDEHYFNKLNKKAIRNGLALEQLKVFKELIENDFGKKRAVVRSKGPRKALTKVDENNNEIFNNDLLGDHVCGYKEILCKPQYREHKTFVSIQISFDKKKIYFHKYKDCQSHYDKSIASLLNDMIILKYPQLEHKLVTSSILTSITITSKNHILINTSNGILLNFNNSQCYEILPDSEVGSLGLDSKVLYDICTNRFIIIKQAQLNQANLNLTASVHAVKFHIIYSSRVLIHNFPIMLF